jgi:hypothetical protein
MDESYAADNKTISKVRLSLISAFTDCGNCIGLGSNNAARVIFLARKGCNLRTLQQVFHFSRFESELDEAAFDLANPQADPADPTRRSKILWLTISSSARGPWPRMASLPCRRALRASTTCLSSAVRVERSVLTSVKADFGEAYVSDERQHSYIRGCCQAFMRRVQESICTSAFLASQSPTDLKCGTKRA